MVALSDVQSSNSRIATTLPAELVAVFAGATSGIGEYTLTEFARHVRRPRIYFVGRTKASGERIVAACKALNPEGQYVYIQADTSLIRNVDKICEEIRSKENAINLLFLSTGTLVVGQRSEEGLHVTAALITYCRNRFIVNLLPLLQRATALRRVVTVLAATKEGPLTLEDPQGWKITNLIQSRGQAASMVTLSLEALAQKAPTVSFIHDFPGAVKTNIANGTTGFIMGLMKVVFAVIGPFICIPNQESGERHLYLATSAKYPALRAPGESAGVPLEGHATIARGTDGVDGSGVYSVDEAGETAGPKVEELLAGLRENGLVDGVWNEMEKEYKRITGKAVA